MRRIGLLSLIVFFAVGTSVLAKDKEKNTFSASFMGEGGAGYSHGTEAADYRQQRSLDDGSEAEDESVYSDRDLSSMTPSRVHAIERRDVIERSPDAANRNRRTGVMERSMREDAELTMDKEENLRDAPAAAGQYSLWSNLSTPLLLPASRTGSISIDQAKSLSRKDYEAHILSSQSHDKAVAVRGTKSLEKSFSPSKEAVAMRNVSASEGMPVMVEFDISATPGEFRDALANISRETGFKADARFQPHFLGTGHKRVSLRGRLKPTELASFMARKDILRVETDRAILNGRPSAESGMTELLLGLRLPPESSPTEALRMAVERLGNDAGFILLRTIGYQRIPKTSQIVLIVSGRVPVRKVSRVMSDPAVVKVAPAPNITRRAVLDPPAKKAAPKNEKLAHNPLMWALFPMLAVLIGLQAFLRKSKQKYKSPAFNV